MAIKKKELLAAPAEVSPSLEPGGTTIEVLDGSVISIDSGRELTFNDLGEAIAALRQEAKNDESARLRAARIVRAIERQELYKQFPGITSMKAFFPILIEQLAQFWKSATSLKRYLAILKIYVEQLQFEAAAVVDAVSHLDLLRVLVEVDRATGELVIEPDKDGKLGSPQFEDVARLVTFLVTGLEPEIEVEGLGADEMGEVLAAKKLEAAAQTYRELVGAPLSLPAGGWTLANTKAIVAAVRGESGEDEDASSPAKVERWWVGHENFDGLIDIEEIQFLQDGEVIDQIPVGKVYTQEQLKARAGKDKLKIAGLNGEQGESPDDE